MYVNMYHNGKNKIAISNNRENFDSTLTYINTHSRKNIWIFIYVPDSPVLLIINKYSTHHHWEENSLLSDTKVYHNSSKIL